jgi:hypothetical protein
VAAPRVRLLDRRVALALLAIALVLEVVTRTKLFSSSKDFRRFRGYDARAEKLVAGPGPTVALIGNSATDRGVNLPVLERAFGEGGHAAHADLFVADQSRINTWRFILERYFARPERRPDLVVITFYEDDLADGNPVEIGRLAQFFTSVRDWPEVFTTHLHTLGDRVDFVVSSGWATFAASERIRERLLAAFVPDFVEYSEQANGVAFEHRRRRAAARASGRPAAPAAPTYEALRRTLARASEVGLRLCFVAYPTLSETGVLPYEIPPELPAILNEAHVSFIDLRRVPTLRRDLYADEVHVTDEGRVPYSIALGHALAPEIGRAQAKAGNN